MGKESEKGSVVEIVIIIVLVLALVGFVGWRVFDSMNSKKQDSQTGSSQSQSTGDASKQALKTYVSSKDGVTFSYPENWTVTDTSNNNVVAAIVKNSAGEVVAEFGDKVQLGGTCPETSPSYSAVTVLDESLSIKGINATAHYGYTAVQNEDAT